MSLKYRWLIVNVDAEVHGTNDEPSAKRYALDGESVAIDLQQLTFTFDGDTGEIEELPDLPEKEVDGLDDEDEDA